MDTHSMGEMVAGNMGLQYEEQMVQEIVEMVERNTSD